MPLSLLVNPADSGDDANNSSYVCLANDNFTAQSPVEDGEPALEPKGFLLIPAIPPGNRPADANLDCTALKPPVPALRTMLPTFCNDFVKKFAIQRYLLHKLTQ
jgi:hypothetical protein